MSEERIATCQYPIIRAESRDEDIERVLGKDYDWVGGRIDSSMHWPNSDRAAFMEIYEDFMTGFLDSSAPEITDKNPYLRSFDFVSPLRDSVITDAELEGLLAKPSRDGTTYAARIAGLPLQQQTAIRLLMAGVANGLGDEEENGARYSEQEFEGIVNSRMWDAIEEANRSSLMASAFDGGAEGAIGAMNSICATPTSPPPLPVCTNESETHSR